MTKSRGIRKPKGTRSIWLAANQGAHFCQCGCGEAIPLRAEHFNVGVPRYRHGHNPRPVKAKPPRQLCGCGCGELTNYGKRYVSGHNSLGQVRSVETRAKLSEGKSGERNPRYGKPAPNRKDGPRPHGVKDDNRIENLEPMTKADHARHHTENIEKANVARRRKAC